MSTCTCTSVLLVSRTARVAPLASVRLRRSRSQRVAARASSASPAGSAASGGPHGEWWRKLELDWSRRHLQLLFLDSGHSAAARLAESVCEKLAIYNDAGWMLYPHSSGVNAVHGAPADASCIGALWKVGALGDGPRYLVSPAQQLSRSDLDHYDIILCLDTATRDAVLATEGGEEGPYASRVLLLSSFMSFAPDDVILRTGGRALLPRRLLSFLTPQLAAARAVVDIAAPPVSDAAAGTAESDWQLRGAAAVLSVGGLVQFLLDTSPNELIDWKPTLR